MNFSLIKKIYSSASFKKLMNVSRIIVAVILLIIIFQKINLKQFAEILIKINPTSFFVLFALSLIQSMINTFGLKYILSKFKIYIPFSRLIYLRFVSKFFSIAIPAGMIGGDITQLYFISKYTEKKAKPTFAIIIQRITNFYAFILFFFLPVLIFTNIIENNIIKILIILFFIILFFTLAFIYFNNRTRDFIIKRLNNIPLLKRNKNLIQIANSFFLGRDSRNVFIVLIITSILFYIVGLLLRYYILLILNIEIDVFHFISIVIFVTFLLKVPISFAGIGIREVGYIALFGMLGVQSEYALSFSIIEFISPFILYLAFGFHYFLFSICKIRNVIRNITTGKT